MRVILFSLILTGCATAFAPENRRNRDLSECFSALNAMYFQECLDRVEAGRVKKIDEYVAKNPEQAKFADVAKKAEIDIGMSEELLLLSWGEGRGESSTTDENGTIRVRRYTTPGAGTYQKGTLVVTRGGKVTRIDD